MEGVILHPNDTKLVELKDSIQQDLTLVKQQKNRSVEHTKKSFSFANTDYNKNPM